MYLRSPYTDLHIPSLRDFIKNNPLGILISSLPSDKFATIQFSHIPFILDVENPEDEEELGVLRGHLARANPQTKSMIATVQDEPTDELETEVAICFNGATHYVTPKFYVETKPESGKTVPTWDYEAVQAYGQAKIYYNNALPETAAFIHKTVADLSVHAETTLMGYTGKDGAQSAWTVDEAPESYIKMLRQAIIGIEIRLTRLEGKWKMSQEAPVGDIKGVIQGFQQLGTETGDQMAQIVTTRCAKQLGVEA